VDTDAVLDASRISPPVLLPGYPHPVRFSLNVDVCPVGLPVQNWRSSLHAVVADQAADGTIRLAVQPGERLNRDFILRYQLGAETIQTSLTLVPDAPEAGEGTYLLTVVPPTRQARVQKPRDVVFVLDRSGSMSGWKMVAARRALGRMIDSLTERDRFAAVAFDDTMETPPALEDVLLEATDRQRFRTLEWLANIDARGGTEMAQPLDWAVKHLTGERDRVLVLVTDGQVGNEDQILQLLGQRLRGIRIFTLGIDRAVNEGFLKRLALLGGGSCDVVESEDRLDEVMDKVQRRIGSPLLTGLRLEVSGVSIDAAAQVPARLPDLFAGVPLQLMGRYRGGPRGSVTLRADDETGRVVTQTVAGRMGHSSALASLWARGRLRDLEDRWVVGSEETPEELEKKIVALSLKFGVLCRFTAFVAVDRSAVVNEGGQQHHLVQPVEAVEGWQHEQQWGGGAVMACLAAPTTPTSFVPEAFNGLGVEEMDTACFAPGGPPEDGAVDSYLLEADGEVAAVDEEAATETEQLQETTDPDQLSAYRLRALDLLAELRADGDPVHGLGVLSVKLAALLDDLRSTGAGVTVLEPLQLLLAQLRQLLVQPAAAAVEVRSTWHQAETVLETFLGHDRVAVP
jgi:Ca-activated chloride channel family protein